MLRCDSLFPLLLRFVWSVLKDECSHCKLDFVIFLVGSCLLIRRNENDPVICKIPVMITPQKSVLVPLGMLEHNLTLRVFNQSGIISTMIYSQDIPLWSETLKLCCVCE